MTIKNLMMFLFCFKEVVSQSYFNHLDWLLYFLQESVLEYFQSLRQKHDIQVYVVFGGMCLLAVALLWRK